MIQLTLEVTVDQLKAIADIMGGDYIPVAATVTPEPPAPPAVPTAEVTLNNEPATTVKVVEAVHQAVGGELKLDVNGMPWDERIHASTKTFVKDGTWKKKRNVDEALVKQVEAELGTSEPTVPAPPAPPLTPVATEGSLFTTTPAAAVTFNDVLHEVTTGISNGYFDMDEVNEIIAKHGGTDMTSVMLNPELTGKVYTELKGLADE